MSDQPLPFPQRGTVLKTLGLGSKGNILFLHANHWLHPCYCYNRWSQECWQRRLGKWGETHQISWAPSAMPSQGTVCIPPSRHVQMGQEHTSWVSTSPHGTSGHHFLSMQYCQVVELLRELFFICQTDDYTHSTVWCCVGLLLFFFFFFGAVCFDEMIYK